MVDYEQRNEYNSRRNSGNAEILVEQGVDEATAIAICFDLAQARHEFHSGGDRIFNAESNVGADKQYEALSRGLDVINQLVGAMYDITPYEEWIGSEDYDYGIMKGTYEEILEAWHEQHREINNTIELAMLAVDRKYGTHIAPTGKHRE